MSVDLPAPFSPQIAWISPGVTSRLTSLSALTPGNVLVIERISRIGWTISIHTFLPPVLGHNLTPGRVERECPESPFQGGHRALPESLLQLVGGVVTGVDEDLLHLVLGHRDRLQEVRRHHPDAVVVGLGVVDLRLLVL